MKRISSIVFVLLLCSTLGCVEDRDDAQVVEPPDATNVDGGDDGSDDGKEQPDAAGDSDRVVWFQGDDNRYGLRSAEGKELLKPTYDDVKPFSEGLAPDNQGARRDFGGMVGGKWGYVNETGKLVIPVQYKFAFPHSDGLALVATDESPQTLAHRNYR